MYIQKIFKTVFYLVLIVLLTSRIPAQISEAEKLYESGIYQLEAIGDFDEAIKIFNRVVKEYPTNKTIAAKALLKLGFCYERLGSQKAEESYTQIIEKFPDQAQQVAEARERLSVLRQQSEGDGQTIKLNTSERYLTYLTYLALSPDGSKIAGIDYSIGQNISVYDFNSKETKLVTSFKWAESPADGWTAGTVWSPDGEQVAYFKGSYETNGGELWISTLDGKARKLISKDEGVIGPCDWLKDGSGIVVMLKDSSGYTLGIVSVSDGKLRILRSFEKGSLNDKVLYTVASASPDGQFIVFEEGIKGARDIKIISSDGNKIIILTDGPADDAQPLWSPDGNHIIFKSNRHGSWALWGVVIKEGNPMEQPFMISAGFDDTELLNWSQPGLAYDRTITLSDIYSMPVDSVTVRPIGNAQQIKYTPTGSNIRPVWSPDGKYLAFVSNRGGKSSPGYLVVVSFDNREPREFKIPMSYIYWTYYFQDLRWTPDGKALTFSGHNSEEELSIFHLTLETGKWKISPLNLEGWTRIAWDKEGKSFFCTHIGKGIVRRDIDDDEEYVYQSPKDSRGVFHGLRTSRDYKWLAFSQDLTDVIAVNLQTGESRVVAPGGFIMPAWLPDNKSLLVIKAGQDENTRMPINIPYLVTIDGGTPEKIDFSQFMTVHKGSSISGLDWSPNGKEVVFSVLTWIVESNLMKTVISKERR